MTEYNEITEDAFTFIKYRCGWCGKIIKTNRNFCNMDCQVLYFEKMNSLRIGTWSNKKKRRKIHIYDLSDILNQEDLKQIIKESEKNIDLRMSKSRR